MMLDVGFIKAIVLAVQILFNVSGAQTGYMDILHQGKLMGTVEYRASGKDMTLYMNSSKAMDITALDNYRYSIKLASERPVTADLSEFFSRLDLKNIEKADLSIDSKEMGKVDIQSGKTGIFIRYDSRLFIINREQLIKKEK